MCLCVLEHLISSLTSSSVFKTIIYRCAAFTFYQVLPTVLDQLIFKLTWPGYREIHINIDSKSFRKMH